MSNALISLNTNNLWLNTTTTKTHTLEDSPLRIEEALADFETQLLFVERLSSYTVDSYKRGVKSFSLSAANKHTSQIKESDIREWLISLNKRKLKTSTVFTYSVGMRQFLGYLKNNKLSDIDKSIIKPVNRRDTVKQGLLDEDVIKIIMSCTLPRERAIISMLFCTGLRVSELCSLNRSDIRDNRIAVVGKGGKARQVYCTSEAKRFVKLYLGTRDDNNDALFLGHNKTGRITPEAIRSMCRYLSKRTGIKFSPHLLRHSFAYHLVRKNANLRVVQGLLGHSTLATTERYTRMMQTDYEKAYNEFF